jgi:hypothetical protein
MSKKIFDLFDYDSVKIEPLISSQNTLVYTAEIKNMETFEMFTTDAPAIEKWIEEIKSRFVMELIGGTLIDRCNDVDRDYFTKLKNDIEMTGEVDQFLWDMGLKRKKI